MRISKLLVPVTFSMLFSSGVAVAADFDKGINAYNSGDFKTALAEWMPLAEQGDAESQYLIGGIYDYGYGVSVNYKTVTSLTVNSVTNNPWNPSLFLTILRQNMAVAMLAGNWHEEKPRLGNAAV